MNAVVKHDDLPVVTEAGSILAVIERAARDSGVDVDKLERLLGVYERITARQAQAAYAAALAEMQPELPMIAERGGIKDRHGNVQSRYALWEDIVSIITPILSKHGFSLSFRTGHKDAQIEVTGVLTHRDGHAEQTTMLLPVDGSGSKNAVQAVGSSTSYGKRYTAAALLNLRTGEVDDDGGAIEYITEDQAADLLALATEVGANLPAFLRYMGVDDLHDIRAADHQRAIAALDAKRRKG